MAKISKSHHVTKDGVVKKNPPKDSQWAGVILAQLGGNRFIAMTGAKDFVRDDEKRQIFFKIGRNSKGVNYVRIRLTSMDLYDMEFLRVRAGQITVLSSEEGVYNDQLETVFTANTGLYTRL
jgi:hypothetical protein